LFGVTLLPARFTFIDITKFDLYQSTDFRPVAAAEAYTLGVPGTAIIFPLTGVAPLG
jgi:hypothetical protein